MDISLIIVNYNVYHDVYQCITSFNRYNRKLKAEIIVVDNNSPERDIEEIEKQFENVILVKLDTNKGFGHANNIGLKQARGNYLFLVNPDIIFFDNTIYKLYDFLDRNHKVAVAGPVQFKPSNVLERYYAFFPTLYSRVMQEFGLYMIGPIMKNRFFQFWDENIRRNLPFQVDWIMGSCMMVRKQIYQDIGGFNEAFFLYEEEVEWQYRMKKAGWISVIIPECKVLHNHHSSTSKFGKNFIYFHEFRSRIIYRTLHDTLGILILKKIFTSAALMIRILFNVFKWIVTANPAYKRKLFLFRKLLSFNFKEKSDIINDRFDFKNYNGLFLS